MRRFLCCALLALSACSTQPPPSSPAPRPVSPPAVITPAPVAPAVPQVAAPARPALADGSGVPAVQGLLDAAERARRAGDLATASVQLERALRMAPQSALVCQRLADLRLQQQRPAEAEQFARKGLLYAAGSSQQALLWRLVAEARRQQGRSDAQEALLRAQQLEAATAGN